jgi:hypothetical protein
MVYDDTLKGFMVVAKKYIPRGSSVNLSLVAPYNDYCLLKKGYCNPLRGTAIPITVSLAK